MNLNEEIQRATDSFVAEKLPEMVEGKVAKMVDGILDDIFRSYSDTAKQIKGKIEAALDINLQKYDLVDYNALVSKAINDRLLGIVNEQAIEPIMELVKETVGFVSKKEIKLSEIHELIIQTAMEENDDEEYGEISFHVEENSRHGWHEVSMDPDADTNKDECRLYFLISGDTGRMFHFRVRDQYAYKPGKKQVTPAGLTALSSMEHKLFRLYSAQVKVTIDETDFDNEWSRNEY